MDLAQSVFGPGIERTNGIKTKTKTKENTPFKPELYVFLKNSEINKARL